MSAPAGSAQNVGPKVVTAWKVGTKPVTAAYVGKLQVA